MKKILFYIAAAIAALTISSCQKKFEPGTTATKNLAGNWMVTVYVPSESDGGEIVYEPYTGCEILTYNTSANVPTEMWLDDDVDYYFWDFKCKIDCNNDNQTFGKDKTVYANCDYESNVKIWGGKITNLGATAPGSETIVDKIEFFAAFDDDDDEYLTPYYFVGYRKTGFPEDNDNFRDDWESIPSVPEDF